MIFEFLLKLRSVMEAQRGLYSFFLGSSGGSGDICKGSDGGDNCRNGSREGG